MTILSPKMGETVPRLLELPGWSQLDQSRSYCSYGQWWGPFWPTKYFYGSLGGHKMTPKTTKNDDFEPENERDFYVTAGTYWVVPVWLAY